VTPTEEEISLLLMGAGHHKQNSVDASEIEYALDLWHSYVTNRPKIEKIFEKYDTDRNQKLEFDQLVRYLTDLNEGHKPEVLSSAIVQSMSCFFKVACIPLKIYCFRHRTPR
jgi:Ca2+-binding EF-hand superfamily protein